MFQFVPKPPLKCHPVLAGIHVLPQSPVLLLQVDTLVQHRLRRLLPEDSSEGVGLVGVEIVVLADDWDECPVIDWLGSELWGGEYAADGHRRKNCYLDREHPGMS
uniref:Uncharacterized protein n=1 Tax=Lygus hesperus TaxID=30085 RepID=A0A0K8TIE0_LYGHE